MGILNVQGADQALNSNQQPIAGAKRYVYVDGTDTLAPIYRDAELTDMRANPMVSDSNGRFGLCYLMEGRYRVVIVDDEGTEILVVTGAYVALQNTLGVLRGFRSVSDLIADQSLAYSGAEDRICAMAMDLITVSEGPYSYRVADPLAEDHHLETAGGIKLHQVSAENTLYLDAIGGAGALDRIGPLAAQQGNITLAANAGSVGAVDQGLAIPAQGQDAAKGVGIRHLNLEKSAGDRASDSRGLMLDRHVQSGGVSDSRFAQFECGIDLHGCQSLRLDGVVASGNTVGLRTQTSSQAGRTPMPCKDIAIRSSRFEGNDTGMQIGALTQGLTMTGGALSGNTVAGVEVATPQADGSAITFSGTSFDNNAVALLFAHTPRSMSFAACHFTNNAELWDNVGPAKVNVALRRCHVTQSHINLDIFEGEFVDNDCVDCTFTASSPTAYQCREWRGTSVAVDDGNVLQSTRFIGSGAYAVEAQGAPGTTALVNGSTWLDTLTGRQYIRRNNAWADIAFVIKTNAVLNLDPVPAQSTSAGKTISLPGVMPGDPVCWTFVGDPMGLAFMVRAETGQVRVYALNMTSAPIDPGGCTFTIWALK